MQALEKKVKVQSLVDMVSERLESAIIDGSLKPGSKISEQALASTLGVSRGPLREAIRRLEGRKLLERIPNIGVSVARLSVNDLHELLLVREELEALACSLAAQAMPDEDIETLSSLLDDHENQKSIKNGTGYYQEAKDFDFHFRIVRASQNQYLIKLLCEDLYYLLRIYRYKSSKKPGRASQALAEHRAIVDALARRDSEAAAQAMRQHLGNARQYIEEQIDDESR